MCDKCIELGGKIEHYRKLDAAISDQLATQIIADRIQRMEAQKVQFHPEANAGLVVANRARQGTLWPKER